MLEGLGVDARQLVFIVIYGLILMKVGIQPTWSWYVVVHKNRH